MGRIAPVLGILGACATLLAQQQAPAPVFRGAVDTVAIYPLVSTNAGRLLTDLKEEDFTVLDNGVPAQITVFSKATQPITAVLMLDMSTSMDDNVVRVREAARKFVDALEPGDRLRIGSFGSEIVVNPLLTSDKAILRRVLDEELWPGGSTRLWSAIDLAMQSIAAESGRRTIVAITDGTDTTSLSQAAVTERAIKGLFMIYAIGLEGKGLSPKMMSLIAATGGAQFDLKRQDDLADALARVTTELRHQYMIGFTPNTVDGLSHTLEVRVNRLGVKVRAPQQFVAAARK